MGAWRVVEPVGQIFPPALHKAGHVFRTWSLPCPVIDKAMEPLIAPGSLREEVPATQRRSRPRGLPDGQPDQHRSTPGSRHAYNKYAHSSRNHRPCRSCGQIHSHHEPHLYNYTDEPVDTPCAHTFCHVCISNYLKINPLCPLDRKPLSEMTINPTNLVLKRLLDKLEVNCPNEDSCEEVLVNLPVLAANTEGPPSP
eukprot:TCALIF_10702-PA protein Name:"Similar to Lnx2 Ligand of Numb protein X 2 (Mus musculus)" AED:0.79 eAED:0.79 QI:0/0/0/0.4/1/1/5/0/196